MKLRNLRKEYKDHYSDAHNITRKTIHPVSEKYKMLIIEKWLTGNAKISEWMILKKEDLNKAYINISEEQRLKHNSKNNEYFDLFIEYHVQEFFFRSILKVHNYAPHRVNEYAQKYLSELTDFFEHKLSKNDLLKFKTKYELNLNIEQFIQNKDIILTEYSDQHIDHQNHYHELLILSRIKEYLIYISKEGLSDDFELLTEEEFSFDHLWPEIGKLKRHFTVFYTSKRGFYKEYAYIDYQVSNVSGFYSGNHLKREIRKLFKTGFDSLLMKLSIIKSNEDKRSILEGIISEIEDLKYLVVDGEYIVEESEFTARSVHNFKKFEKLIYNGDVDDRFIFQENSRNSIAKEMQEFPEAWLDAVSEMERKVEHLINDIDLIGYSQYKPSYSIENLFEEVFVIESTSGMIQGTAFYLNEVGIITCDHCIRGDDGNILKDLEIWRANDIKVKVKVEVVNSNQSIDIALLKLSDVDNPFLGKGLSLGDSDEVNRLDNVGVAGFPNYNFGDSGFFMTGVVTGFRTISSIKHFLVSNHLVAGNSGGPALDETGSVIGVVVTGADKFSTVTTTEKHGLIPINVINFLQWKLK